MINIIISSILFFILGFCLGIFIMNRYFDNQEWVMVRWNKSSLGYRTVSLGSRLMKGDRIIMGLKMNTDSFPEEGVLYDVE